MSNPILTPPIHLGAEPKVESQADADKALACLAWLQVERQKIETRRDAAIGKAKEAARNDMSIRVGRSTLDLDKYQVDLEEAVKAWANVEANGVTTLEVAHGQILRRKNPDRIEPIGDLKALVSSKTQAIADKVLAFLKRLGMHLCWRFKIEPDVAGMKELYKAGKLSDEQLGEQGFRYAVGDYRVDVKLGATKGE